MTTSAIVVRDLHKHYGHKRAVDGLDLTIETGETFAILGPNGAGKSTTVEILEGYRRRTSGEVSVLGLDPAQATREWRSQIGIVLQNTESEGLLSAREQLAHVAGFYPNPRDVDEVIAAVGLEEKSDERAKRMSGGQRRRLDVALGIIGRPKLLFLDEPTTGFDPEARRNFWTMIETLQGEGTTVVLTTHYLDEAERLANRIAVIADGRLRALDTPTGLRSRASTPIVEWTDGTTKRSEVTETPTALVAELHRTLGGEAPDLRVRRPSLEDVYLSLISQTPEELT